METRDWRTWLAEHGSPLLLLARQWVPTIADAEDVVQEAFVRFWPSRHKAADPIAYLYACTRNCAIEWLRDKSRRSRREQSAARSEATMGLFASVENDERRLLIEAALQGLPQEQREVVVMKLWGDLSFPQVGQALGVSPNTAASRYRYAMEKLREQLSPEPAR